MGALTAGQCPPVAPPGPQRLDVARFTERVRHVITYHNMDGIIGVRHVLAFMLNEQPDLDRLTPPAFDLLAAECLAATIASSTYVADRLADALGLAREV